jgi:hypothetical protein
MPPRPPIPADDLYARLGVPLDASAEAIEIAWRGLLRRHHPDVAGADGLEAAKRINVAHDWLSDPDLRERYDAARAPGSGGAGGPAATWSRGAAQHRVPWSAPPRPPRRRPATAAEQVATLVERIGRLTRDDLDRLALAEPAPIAFLATLRRFVPPEVQTALDEAQRAATQALAPAARQVPGIRDAVVGRVVAVVLGDALDELLGEPGAGRVRERLGRGWDAAVGQPRYGPATPVVEALLERLRAMPAGDLRWLGSTASAVDAAGPEDPWPPATSAEEDAALRVSTELAAADAVEAVQAAAGREAAGGRDATRAARAAARVAHLLVLRHAFTAGAFDRLAGPWLGALVTPSSPPGPRVRPRR